MQTRCIFIQCRDATKIREFTLVRYHRRILRPHSRSFLCPNHVLHSRRIQFRTPCCFWLSRLLSFLQSGSIPVFSVTFVTLPPLSISPLTWPSLPLGLPGAVLVMGDWSQVVRLWWRKVPAGVLSSPGGGRPASFQPVGPFPGVAGREHLTPALPPRPLWHEAVLFSLARSKCFRGMDCEAL